MSYIGVPPFGQTVRSLSSYTATAGQTTFYPTGGYTVTYLDVYLNGLRQVNGTDYTAADGLSIVFTDPLIVNDIVEIVVYGTISFADSIRRSGDTLAGTFYTQDLIPSANNTYNLGSATARFNDIYLSNSSIYIGDSVVISANATNLIIANTSGGALALSNTSFPNTGVTAGTYGNSSAIPVLTVDSTGRVTSATTNAVAGVTGFTYTTANATFTITTGAGTPYLATIAANSITTAMLTDSGVTAGAYGNTTAIPVITVDAKGRVTAMSTSSVSGVTGLTWTGANNTLTVATSTTNYSANLNSWTNPVTFSNTVAAGNTTVTGYANVSTTLQVTGAATMANTLAVTGNVTFSNTLAVTGTSTFTGLITGTITSANNADYLDGYHATAFAQLSGATYTGAVSGITTLAAGNTTITGWANVTGNTTVGGTLNATDVIISGNLTTSGTTTYINTTNLNVGDNLVVLNADLGIAAAPTEDAGLVINRGSAANVQFNWDETNDRWALGNTYITGTITSTSAASIGSTLAAGNTTITGFANVSGGLNVGGGSTLTSATFTGPVSGVTTIATGNTTITGFANVSSTLNVTGAATFANTMSVTGLITGTVTSANNADYLDGQHGAYYAANSQLASYALLSGATFTGSVAARGTVAVRSAVAGNPVIFSFEDQTGTAVAEIGRVDGTASTPAFDFHTSATAVDYDVRIQASGNNGVTGKGILTTTANVVNFVANVGISNAAPTHNLSVNGTSYFGSSVNVATTFAAGNTTITGFANVSSTLQVNGNIKAESNVVIRYSGGSGELATPYAALTVNGPGASANIHHDEETTLSTVMIRGNLDNVNLQLGTGAGYYNYAGWIQASYDNGGTNYGTEPLLLNPSGGNVGINTGNTSPSYPLTVTGQSYLGGNTTVAGHVLPSANNTYNLGSSTMVWQHMYTGDLFLSNEGHEQGNDVDGTKGKWVVQEGAENLYIINRNTGKKYKFELKEVE